MKKGNKNGCHKYSERISFLFLFYFLFTEQLVLLASPFFKGIQTLKKQK